VEAGRSQFEDRLSKIRDTLSQKKKRKKRKEKTTNKRTGGMAQLTECLLLGSIPSTGVGMGEGRKFQHML
jgi:hypothetical protein